MNEGDRRKPSRFRLAICVWSIVSIALWIDTSAARPLNQDYYAAAGSEELQKLLVLVDGYHTKKIFNAIVGKNYGQAKNDLDYTLATFPNHPEALQLLMFYARATKSPSVAVPYFERAVQMYPQYSMTHLIYGTFLSEFGLLKEALKELGNALKIEPNLALAHVWLAKTYDKAGDKEATRSAAQKAIELGYRGKLLDDILKKH